MELDGIYAEFDVFSWDKITVEHIQALEALGFVLRWDYDKRLIKVLYDTSVMEHERCGEPLDSLEMIA